MPFPRLSLALLTLAGCVTAVQQPPADRELRRFPHPDGSPLMELRGQVHVHSLYSHDSSGSLRDVVDAASDTGCDFVIITDHNRHKALPFEGFQERARRRLLLLVGIEYSSRHGHLLDLFPRSFYPQKMPTQELLDLIVSEGGFPVVAHPLGRPRWQGWHLTGVAGVEIYNTAADVREDASRVPGRLLRALTGRRDALLSSIDRPADTLTLWQDLESQGYGPLVGVGGSNAHGSEIGGNLNWDSYWNSFSLHSNRVWVRSFDKAGIEEAFRAGRVYVVFDGLGDPAGFSFEYRHQGRRWILGESVPETAAGGELTVRCPRPARIVLYRNGDLVASQEGEELVRGAAGTGIWRVEIEVREEKFGNWYPWILSNPIRIGSVTPTPR